MGVAVKILRRFAIKVALVGIVLGLALGSLGLWLGLREKVDFAQWRSDRINSIKDGQTKLLSALVKAHERMGKITADLATEQGRIRQAAGVITQLKGLDSTWDRLTGDAQQKANRERREKLEKEQAESKAHLAALQEDYTRIGWERDGLEIELAQLGGQLKTVEASQSKVMHYLGLAWNQPMGGMKFRAWVLLVLGLYFFVPMLAGLAKHHSASRQP